MSDLKIRPELVESWITHIESNGQSVVIWAQTDCKSSLRFESILNSNYSQLIKTYFKPNRQTERPLIGKYYVFCEKSRLNFYRVFVKSIDPIVDQSMVQFIDFGYEESVSVNNLFVFDGLFFDCKPLAQKLVLADIRPKDTKNGWNCDKVCNCLKKYLQSVNWFEIYDQLDAKYTKVYDNNKQQFLIQTLLYECPEEVVVEEHNINRYSVAIEYNVSSIGSSVGSVSDVTQTPIHLNSKIENQIKTEEKDKSTEEIKCEPNVEKVDQLSDGMVEDKDMESITKSPNNLIDFESIDDKTDKNSLTFHLNTLLGPKRMIYITKTFSNNSFYCHLSENFHIIDKLTLNLNNFYNKTIETKEFELNFNDLRSDSIIAAQFTADQNWYRASVQLLNNSQTEVQVLYIDFGNCETLDLKFCRYLVEEFRSFPPQAIHCRPLNEGLGAETLEIYETNGEEIECEFVLLKEHSIDVFLFENGVLLKDALNESSNPENKVPIDCKELDPKSDEKTTEDQFEDFIPTDDHLISNNFNEEMRTESEVCEQKTESIAELSQSVVKDIESESKITNNLIDLNENPVKNLQTVQQKAEFKDKTDRKSLVFYLRALFGPKRMVYITKTLKNKSFYCQLAENFDIIEELTEDLNNFYNKTLETNEYELNSNDIAIDSIIAVKYTADDAWYRASVQAHNPTRAKVKVFYIDFGNNESRELKYCRVLVPQFRVLHRQAIHCRPLNECLSADTIKNYETNVLEIECEFIALDGHTIDVNLYENGVPLKDAVKESPKSGKKVSFESTETEEKCTEKPSEDRFAAIEQKLIEIEPKVSNRCDVKVESRVQNTENGDKIEFKFNIKKYISSNDNSLSDSTEKANNLNKELISEAEESEQKLKTIPELNESLVENIESDSKTGINSSDLSRNRAKTEVSVRQSPEFIDETDVNYLICDLIELFGQKRLVYITNNLTENLFYCQLAENYSIIEQMGEQLNEFYNKTLETNEYELNANEIAINSVIAVQFSSDANWYRALVQALNTSKTRVQVFYFDFGNYESRELKYCRVLVPQFRALHRQAIHCRPLNECLSDEILVKYEANSVEIDCEFIELIGNTFDVLLYEDGVPLRDEVDECPKAEEKVSFECKESSEKCIEKAFETRVEDITQNLVEFEPKVDNRCETTIEKAVQQSEYELKVRTHLERLSGLSKEVLVSSALSAKSIYCQLCESIETFESLSEDMTEYYNTKLNTIIHQLTESDVLNNPSMIAVFCNLEDKWLRAQVCAVKDANRLEVFYVDVGSKSIVELKDCKQLLDSYASPVPMAVHCSPINPKISYYLLKRMESNERPIRVEFQALDDNNVLEVLINLK